MSKRYKPGDKLLIDGRVATVMSKPAAASGMQEIHWDHVPYLLWGAEWRPWQDLAKLPKVTPAGEGNE